MVEYGLYCLFRHRKEREQTMIKDDENGRLLMQHTVSGVEKRNNYARK